MKRDNIVASLGLSQVFIFILFLCLISDGNNSRSFRSLVCWKLAEARHHGENVCVVSCKLLDKRAGQQKARAPSYEWR